jgi:putative ABC transport system permease protein
VADSSTASVQPTNRAAMKFLALIWSNLRRKKLRTSLTLLSIFVAFLLFGLLCTIKEAFTAGVALAGADRLVVRHKVSLIMTLPVTYKARMERIPGVAAACHFTWFNGIYQNEPKNFFGSFPVEPEPFLDLYPEYVLPAEQKQAWLKTRTGAIVGRALVDRFQWKIGDRVPLTSPIWPRKGDGAWEFEIVGIYEGAKKGTDTSGFYFRYDYFDEGRAFGEGLVGWYGARVNDPDRAAEAARAIDAEFANSPHETKAEPEGAFMQGFAQQVGDIGTILIAILSAVFFTILLVAGNTMAQAVRERTEELGVLKALGFTNERVLALVLGESCLIAAAGGLTGLGAIWLLVTVGGSPVPTMLPVFYLPTRYLIIGAALVGGLGIVAGILPALQAMRLQIAVALRRHA